MNTASRSWLFVAGAAAAAAFAWVAFRPVAPDPPAPPQQRGEEARPSPPDPRLTSETPFRNVRPGVNYVGDSRCAGCHGDLCNSYHVHPMGRSAALVGGPGSVESYAPGPGNPCRAGGYELRATRTAGVVTHRVAATDAAAKGLPEYVVTPAVAVGSGTRGRSYVALEGGAAWQSPLSWYSAGPRWDVSPGFDLGNGGRRAIGAECFFCHVNRVEPVPLSVNRLREPTFPTQVAIGCERCHGPGELHVDERTAGALAAHPDTSVVNPRHLSADLQSAVCQQCHLHGQERVPRRGRDAAEFRPALPFSEFVRVFVRPPEIADTGRSVGQFEQVEASRCATAGGGRLLCTSCHDPHKSPAAADRDAHYRDRCLTCHTNRGCSESPPARQAKADSCVACHMPKAASANIVHTSVTDHRVLRRPVAPAPLKGLPAGAVPLLAFRGGTPGPEQERDLGVALSRLAGRLPPGSGARQTVSRMARERLSESLTTWPGDGDALLALSRTAATPADRLDAAERAQRLAPGSESALAELAEAAVAAGRFDRAEEAATKLIALSPTSVEYRMARASAAAARGLWARAEDDCRAALATQPLHPFARLVLAASLHHRGDPDAARKEADAAVALATHPQQKQAFRDWFRRETR
jgi:predicted CXXCH cytochrome family protein